MWTLKAIKLNLFSHSVRFWKRLLQDTFSNELFLSSHTNSMMYRNKYIPLKMIEIVVGRMPNTSDMSTYLHKCWAANNWIKGFNFRFRTHVNLASIKELNFIKLDKCSILSSCVYRLPGQKNPHTSAPMWSQTRRVIVCGTDKFRETQIYTVIHCLWNWRIVCEADKIGLRYYRPN